MSLVVAIAYSRFLIRHELKSKLTYANPLPKYKDGFLLYPLYNQTIETQFDLSLLGLVSERPSGAARDRSIRINQSNADIPSSLYLNNQTSVNKKYGYYYRENVGLYEFINGNEMKVSPLTNDFGVDFIRVLLNYPMACLLYQQGYFLLHASAVAFQDKVFLFPGRSLCGKSTIAAYLVKNGGKLITEDTAVIQITDEGAFIFPSYPVIKISEQANDFIGLSRSAGVTFPLDKNARKGHFLNSSSFLQGPAKIDFCIFPEWDCKKPSLKKVYFAALLGKLLESSLTIFPLDKDKEKDLLSANAKFLRSVDTYTYKRDKSFSTLGSLAKSLETL